MIDVHPAGAVRDRPAPIGSYRYTAILVAIFVVLAAGGARFQRASEPGTAAAVEHPSVVPIYLTLIAGEWALVLFVWKRGLRNSETRLRDLIGGRWGRWQEVARDIALALLAWIAWVGIQRGFDLWGGADHARSVGGFLPQGPGEVILWIALSLSAGFCEEIVFRGYLQRQFAALTRSQPGGICLQGLLFGIAHGYQGVGAMLRILLYGLLFGALAHWRKSLRPGMAAHAWSDIYSGWLGAVH